MNTTDWVKTMQGKSRWDLKFNGCGLYLPDNRILVADVYDDYLIFNLLTTDLTPTELFMIAIDALNDADAASIARRIDDELAKH